MSTLGLVFTLIAVAYFYFWHNKKNSRRDELLAKFVSPKSFPFIKHGIHFLNSSPIGAFHKLLEINEKLGNVWKLELPFDRKAIAIQDVSILKEVLSSQTLIVKSDDYNLIVDWLGQGILISKGNKWRGRRKLINNAFQFKILEQFIEIMARHGKVFVEKMKKFQDQDVDIFPLISLYTLDVICESAMGYQLNSQIGSNVEYVKLVKEKLEIALIRGFSIFYRMDFFYRLSKMFKREIEVVQKLHDFTDSVINERRKDLRDFKHANENKTEDDFGVKKKFAFLDLLLQAEIDGEPLDDEGIREEVDTMTFTGSDTVASAISFTLLNLAKYKDIQEKVFEECREVVGDDIDRVLTMKDLNQLNYLEKVIKETLRLYPAVPYFFRNIDTEFTAGGYTFPEGIKVVISPYALGHDAKYFPNPKQFDPSRFDSEEAMQAFSYIPFSAGPRNCIGQKYAMLELKTIVTKIIMNFELSVKTENRNPIIYTTATLAVNNGVNISMKERK